MPMIGLSGRYRLTYLVYDSESDESSGRWRRPSEPFGRVPDIITSSLAVMIIVTRASRFRE
jgi:hypothetical protein